MSKIKHNDHLYAAIDHYDPLVGIPELVIAGKTIIKRTHINEEDELHVHDALEILYMKRGVSKRFGSEEPHFYELRSGQVAITQHKEKHGAAENLFTPCEMYWVCVSFEAQKKGNFLGLPKEEAWALCARLRQLPQCCFPVPAVVETSFDRILANLSLPENPFRVLDTRAALLELLLAVLRAGQNVARPPRQSVLVKEAIQLMNQNLARPLALSEISKKLGWALSYFKNQFKKQTGLSPAYYYLRQRVNCAREKLAKSNDQVKKIGLDLGFSSSHSFTIAFKRVTGLTPRAFRLVSRKKS